MATTGKNEPCYCGSGLVYGQCCYNEDVLPSEQEGAGQPARSVLSGLEGREFGSLEEAKEAAQRIVDAGNRRPLDDFCGLSPEEMFRFLHHPFNSSDVVSFNMDVRRFPETPLFKLFPFLIKAAAKEKLKATAKGRLPVALVREAALLHYGEEKYRQKLRYMAFRTETDLPVLHTVRLAAELAGFLLRDRGCFELTKDGVALAEKGMDGAAFMRIFEAYTRKFNWGYSDLYPELHIIQQAFLFTLYLLSRFGKDFRSSSFYEDLFLTAFPAALRNVPQSWHDAPEETVKRCFTVRALERFAHFLGFAEFYDTQKRLLNPWLIRKTPFLEEWVRFPGIDKSGNRQRG